MTPLLLSEMLTELRHEARLSSSVSHGSHLEDRHISLLRRVQQALYDSYDWPVLQGVETVTIAAGLRHGAYPARTSFEGIESVYCRMEGETDWYPLTYGIEPDHLDQFDSDAGETGERVMRWQHHQPPEAERTLTDMFEVWPLADRDAQLRFERKRKLDKLVDRNTDYSTIDGLSIVLHAAAEILAGQKAEDADLKLQKAIRRVEMMRARQASADNRRVTLGLGRPTPERMGRWHIR